jgi:hypothetical protein
LEHTPKAAIAPRIAFLAPAVIGADPQLPIAASSNRPTEDRYREDLSARANPGEECGRGAGWSETNEELAIARDRVAVIS